MAYDLTTLKQHIKETEERLARELGAVRTGRATPTLLDVVKVEAYGARTSLIELASISVEDARTIRVAPWDSSITKNIEKGITEANLGVGVAADDQGIRITFPELTGERRIQLRKIAGDKTEQAKIALRGHRTDALKNLEAEEDAGGMGKDEIARYKVEIQKLIDAGNEVLLNMLARKESEIAQ